jgi:hypothetical protein
MDRIIGLYERKTECVRQVYFQPIVPQPSSNPPFDPELKDLKTPEKTLTSTVAKIAQSLGVRRHALNLSVSKKGEMCRYALIFCSNRSIREYSASHKVRVAVERTVLNFLLMPKLLYSPNW